MKPAICGRCKRPAVEKQRVAIGRALIKNPTFLFADERPPPSIGSTANRCWSCCAIAAHDGGATILVVAHDNRMIPFADRVFHLDDGVLADGAEQSLPLFASTSDVAAAYDAL